MNEFSEEIPTPPSANPTTYCHFCYSQFRVKPMFTESQSETEALLSRIESLIQVQLNPERDQGSAICYMCQHKLIEFEMFRERCQKLHEAVRRDEGQSVLDQSADFYSQGDYSSVREEDSFGERSILNETFKQLNATELTFVDPKDIGKNNRFWQALSCDVDSIPKHIRTILELSGRCRQASLAFISPSTIKRFEESMQNSIEMLVDHEERHGNVDRRKALVKYYGAAHWERPERFCFSEEERTTILAIASAVQRKGIAYYLKNVKKIDFKVLEHWCYHGRERVKQELKKVNTSREQAESLVAKIRKYYQARDSQSEKFQNFFEQLPGLKHIRIGRTLDGTVHATIRCPICKRVNKAGLTKGCYWNIHSFVKHCQARHYQTEVVKLRGGSARLKVSRKSAKSDGKSESNGGSGFC